MPGAALSNHYMLIAALSPQYVLGTGLSPHYRLGFALSPHYVLTAVLHTLHRLSTRVPKGKSFAGPHG